MAVVGILQKGDGTNVFLKDSSDIISPVIGTGHQRLLACNGCNGKAVDLQLLTPMALAAGADGSIYVGDFNLVRKINPDGIVNTLLELK